MSCDQDSGDVKEGNIKGEYEVVYFIPEMILVGKRRREILLGEVYSHPLKTFIIDEAHTVKKW